MNLVTQKFANDLVARYLTSHQIPGSLSQTLSADMTREGLETWEGNLRDLRSQDDGPTDLWPGTGKVFTHLDQGGMCVQNCVDYWGDSQDGEVSSQGQCRGALERDRHVYARYTPSRVDTLEVEAHEDRVMANAFHLDREHPEQSSVEYYIWPPLGGERQG